MFNAFFNMNAELLQMEKLAGSTELINGNSYQTRTKVCLKKIGSWHIFVGSSLCIHAM